MQISDSKLKELLAENEAALERLLVAIERHGRLQMACMVTMAGVVVAALGVIFTVWSG